MPQSLSQVYIHCVFSTKHRRKLIKDRVRDDLHAYIIGTIANLGSYVYEIYANPDHIHILCTLPRTITIADLLSKVKSSSSKWLKTQGISPFAWQGGYATFSVSASDIANVQNYIRSQPMHHNAATYQDELRKLLKDYNVEYDEQYIWD